jgi:hypothetical protein
VRYVLDFLRNHQGVADPIAYIADVDREDRQLEVRARRARRLAAFRA